MMQLACQPITAVPAGQPLTPVLGGMLGSNWLVLSVLALVVSTLALSILYMVASFLRNPQFLSWTKFELFQVFGTAVIMAFFGMTLYGMCTFDLSWLDSSHYTHGENMYKIIGDYFDKVQTAGYLIYGYIMYVTKILTFVSRVTVLSSPLGVGSNENPLESMGQMSSLIFIMLSGFITSFLLFQLQMRMLDYLAFACIGYLFPMGIFFRCFEPTRSFGGTLLGISVSLFLFYPIIMVFNDYLMYDQINKITAEQRTALAASNNAVARGAVPTGQSMSSGGVSITNPNAADPTDPNRFFENVTGGYFSS